VFAHSLRRLVSCLISLLFPLFIAAAVEAQQPLEPWNAPHFSIEPKALYEAASAVTAPEGTSVALLDEDYRYSFDESGRVEIVGHYVYKVLTQKGAEGWDSLSVAWEPWHEARPVIRVRVIAPDFSVHELDPKTITEEPARGGDYKTYSDGKRVRAPFPAIAPGVVVEEEYTESEIEPFFASGHTGRFTFGEERVPVAHCHAVIDAPASLPLRIATLLLPDLKPVRTEANGRVTLTYDLGPLEGVEPRDPNIPPDVARFPEIQFSTGRSWQVMASEYSKIVDSHAGASAVQAIVDKLIAGKTTAAEKEAAIVDYLDREVRYTGIEFGEAALVPHDPAETLNKKYGDCKDKATLTVAMLRAAGIPAYVALLNAGSRMDVPADLPGMGLFDHAIVYVPGPPALWIDATDRYARLGQLPISDQGRLALVARPETTALLKTPESTSKDNVLLEFREIELSENGPATITERTQPKGIFESYYRSSYADRPDKEAREGITNYVKNQYRAESLDHVDRTDPTDLSHQFELTIKCLKARRGYTDLDSAQAAIPLGGLFMRLPDELKRKDDADEKKKQDDKEKPKKPRTVDWELSEPFSAEWDYRIVPPSGFVPKELPKDQTILIGPAVLTERFSVEKDNAVSARVLFDSVKRRYTVAEAKDMQDKIAEIFEETALLVNFEPRGEALLHEGKVKEALAEYRNQVAQHPNEAVHHLRVAQVLLDAGMGEAARAEAREAVRLDPKSALAEKTLAQILKHDLVGRILRAGSDLKGAEAAYRASIKLDPDEDTTVADLAILLEHDPVGRRYGRQAKMKEAIAEYQKLGLDKLTSMGVQNNLSFSLFYGNEPEEAIKAALNLNPQPAALIAASEALLHGSKVGLAEANKRSSSDAAFKDTARTAGEMLMNMRAYALAADFLEAGAAGDKAAQIMGLAAALRGAQRHEDLHFANTPSDLGKQAFLLTMDPELTEAKLAAIASRNSLEVWKNEDAEAKKKILGNGKEWNSALARDDSSLDVHIDIVAKGYDPKIEGDDQVGYRVKAQIPDGPSLTYFAVKDNGQYKVLDTSQRPDAIALEIADRVNAGDLKGAKTLLDWLREDSHIEGGDDPLGGPVFPRLWTKGQAPDARKMKLAAAALMADAKPVAARGVAILEEALKDAASQHEKTYIRIALADGYSTQDNYAKLLEVSAELLKDEPLSRRAFMDSMVALMGLNRFDEALKLADDRLKQLDGDTDALMMKMETEANRGDYAAAREVARKMVDQGKENAELLNSLAWYALFMPKVEQSDIDASIKSTQLAKDNPHILHTVACLYAASGKAKEGRELLMRSMDDLDLDEPNDDYWYALGLIAEQFGEREIAIADYRKLEKPKEPLAIPTSSYKLAQARLKALEAEAKK